MAPELITIRHGDGYEASARYWPDAGVHVRGAVLYLHGIQSHGEWFEESASRLAESGLAVLMPDRRGSGRNMRDRGHAPSAARVIGDAIDALDELQRRTGRSAASVVGVSWGGKLALNLVKTCPARIASLTLVAPGLFPIVDLPASEKMRVVWSVLADRQRLFPIPINEPEMFTANPPRLEYIRDDPLRLRDVTAAFLIASRRLDRFTSSARLHAGVPARLFLAEHDRIIDNEATRRWFQELGWSVRDIVEYKGAHHTLEFEPAGCSFVRDLADWLASEAAGAAF
jgi:alpha-beta hydrolase superfamily lysophospholipase